MKKAISVLLTFVMILGAVAVGGMSVSADGDGIVFNEADNRYEISDYAGLKEFASRVNGGERGACAVLTADIDASASAEDNDWTPIGNFTYSYTGTFDGNGHKITGLTINNTSADSVGLFGCVGGGGKARNVGLEGGSITGAYNGGGVAGINYGTVTNCYNTGSVTVTAQENGVLVGGVAGINYGTVTNCYNTGSVTATGNYAYAGGVVGDNHENAKTVNCYNTGSVTATGDFAFVGGVVGFNSSSSTISNCYNTGSVTAPGTGVYVGSVAGDNLGGTVKYCYYDKSVCGEIGAVNDADDDTNNVTGLTTSQMTGSNAAVNMIGLFNDDGSSDDWCITASYPKFFIKIGNYAELKAFASRVNNGETGLCAKLANDIDASASAEDNDWTPIGNNSKQYTGTFDGNGHKITGLTFNNPSADYVGLFGYVGEGGKVQNVGLEGGSITGRISVGGVVGFIIGGTVTNCYNTGAVSGNDNVGGVVGDNAGMVWEDYYVLGQVINCRNTGPVSSERAAGGVVGSIHNGTVENCYNTGDVTAASNNIFEPIAGGIAGGIVMGLHGFYNISVVVISDCYNTGKITATAEVSDAICRVYAGGITGSESISNPIHSGIENCYNTGDVYAALKSERERGESDIIYAGGINGSNSGIYLTGCCNTGDVTAESTCSNIETYAGGLAGHNENSVNSCYNTGNVTVKSEFGSSKIYTGGLIGKKSGIIQSCYNTGDVSVTAAKTSENGFPSYIGTGGVAGENEAEITGCYNTGNVTVTATDDDRVNSYCGGVAGQNHEIYVGTCKITNCYYDRSEAVIPGASESNNWNAVGINEGGTVTNVKGMVTEDMTGENALMLGNMAGFTDADWLVKENEPYCVYYPHLKGYNLDEEGQQISADEILFANWPPKHAEYPLWVGGNQVTSDNMDLLDALDGISVAEGGSVKFEQNAEGTGGTLYLNNATITGTKECEFEGASRAANILVENTDFDLTINLLGENIINGGSDYGIWLPNENKSAALTIEGEGSLDIKAVFSPIKCFGSLTVDGSTVNATATGQDGYFISSIYSYKTNITGSKITAVSNCSNGAGIECDDGSLYIDDSIVTATGSNEGILIIDGNSLTVSGESVVTANGGSKYGGIKVSGDFVFNDGNEIVTPDEYTIGDDYGSKIVNDKDGNVAKKVVIGQPCTVTFENFDGTELQSGKILKGTVPEYKGETPTREQTSKSTYTFLGWNPEISEITEDTVYTATFTDTVNEYKIRFVNEDGTVLQSGAVAYGETPEYKGETPTKEATAEYTYEFVGWSPEISEVTGDVIYTATFRQIPVEYELTWMVDGESYKNETIPFGTEITKPVDPEKEGYTFKWVDDIPETMPAKDVTINGEFTAIEYTATFVADGETVDTVHFTVEDSSITEPAVPEKEGNTGEWESYTLGAEDITVKAIYTPNEYTITYVIDGNETEVTYEYGAAVEKPADPVKDGFDFIGWDAEIPETMPAENLTITALFEAIPEPVEPTPTEPTPTEPTPTEPTPTETEPVHEHNYKGEVTTKPTCTEDGIMTYTCECGESYTQAIPKTGHKPGEWTVVTPATTEAAGKEVRKCEVCEEVLAEREIAKLEPQETDAGIVSVNLEKTNAYGIAHAFGVDPEKLPAGSTVTWYVNGEKAGEGNGFRVDNPTENYTIKAVVTNRDGKVIGETEETTVKVNNCFFARLYYWLCRIIQKVIDLFNK